MKKKLTLTIDEDIVRRAKSFAKSANRSLSEIVGNYLDTLQRESTEQQLPPIVNSLKGSFKVPNLDYKEGLQKSLEEKYLFKKVSGDKT